MIDVSTVSVWKAVEDSGWFTIIAILLMSAAGAVVQRRYFSPISNIPGPLLASITRLHHVFHIFKGNQSEWITKLHDKYGPFVRIAPDEVSVSHPDAPRKLLLTMLDKVSPQRRLRITASRLKFFRALSTRRVPYRTGGFRAHSPCAMRSRS